MPTTFTAEEIELIKSAVTAMDQTYGKTAIGYNLQPIDNSGQGKSQPWTTPAGWTITDSIQGDNFGGKFVVYRNEATNQVMLVPMGTNGNDDAKGWAVNSTDFGYLQWASDTTGTGKAEPKGVRVINISSREYTHAPPPRVFLAGFPCLSFSAESSAIRFFTPMRIFIATFHWPEETSRACGCAIHAYVSSFTTSLFFLEASDFAYASAGNSTSGSTPGNTLARSRRMRPSRELCRDKPIFIPRGNRT